MIKYLVYNKLRFGLVLLAKTLSIITMILIAFCSSFVLQWSISGRDITSLFILIGVVAAVIFSYFACNFLNYRLTVYYAIGSINKLRKDFIFHLFNLPYNMISNKDSAYYISLLSKDLAIVEDQYFSGMFIIYDNVVMVIGSIIAITILHWSLSLIMIALSLLLLIVPIIFTKTLNKKTNNLSEETGQYIGKLKSIIQGAAIIYAYKAKKYFIKQLDTNSDSLAVASKQQSFANSMLSLTAQTMVHLIQMSVIIYGGYLIYKKEMLASELIALMSLLTMFYNPLVNLGGIMAMVQSTKQIRDKFMEVINETKADKEKLNNTINDITVSNLTFAYTEREVLHEVNLRIPFGSKILILGESGSGKSTLLKIIANLITVDDNSAFLGDVAYADLDFEEISAHLSYVQQDSYIFNDTVQNNIVLGKKFDSDKFKKACMFCNINSLIDHLDNGVDTIIDEELNQLSGGEKSRINLARAIYADKPIILLDEVTSALDKQNSGQIENRLLTMLNKTVIMVCHKIGSDIIKLFDKIVIIENGKIICDGNYDELKNSDIISNYLKIIN